MARPQLEDSAARPPVHSDYFRMFCFKVLPCPKRSSHEWTSCPYAHPGEKARRRDPRKYNYLAIPCEATKNGGTCPRGDDCPASHSLFEAWLHPSRYRTQLCRSSDGAACGRKICFFAHSVAELRVPDPSHLDIPAEMMAQHTASSSGGGARSTSSSSDSPVKAVDAPATPEPLKGSGGAGSCKSAGSPRSSVSSVDGAGSKQAASSGRHNAAGRGGRARGQHAGGARLQPGTPSAAGWLGDGMGAGPAPAAAAALLAAHLQQQQQQQQQLQLLLLLQQQQAEQQAAAAWAQAAPATSSLFGARPLSRSCSVSAACASPQQLSSRSSDSLGALLLPSLSGPEAAAAGGSSLTSSLHNSTGSVLQQQNSYGASAQPEMTLASLLGAAACSPQSPAHLMPPLSCGPLLHQEQQFACGLDAAAAAHHLLLLQKQHNLLSQRQLLAAATHCGDLGGLQPDAAAANFVAHLLQMQQQL